MVWRQLSANGRIPAQVKLPMFKRPLLAGLLLLLIPPALSAQNQPCTIRQHDNPICDRAAFQKTFDAARSVTINSDKLDPYASHQLREQLLSMHKQVVPVGSHSQLGFELTQPSTDGILIGPAGVVIARLQVFGPGGQPPAAVGRNLHGPARCPLAIRRALPAAPVPRPLRPLQMNLLAVACILSVGKSDDRKP